MKTPRRGFLDFLLSLTAVGWLASLAYPVIRFLKPLPEQGPGGPIRLATEELAKLDKDHFVIVQAVGKRLLVFQDAALRLHAFDAKCTHEGCTVQYLSAESVIWCACHNARFDLDGRVVSGPPPRPLPRYRAERQDNGDIIVVAEKEAG